jgi:hypothetical protein
MTTREPPTANAVATGRYLYGVVRADALAALEDAGLDLDGFLLPVCHEGLCGLTSAVPAELGREALVRHADLTQRVFERVTILPARFGVVFSGADQVVAELLRPYQDQLTAQLDRLDGMVQVDVTCVHREEQALALLLRSDRALAVRRREATRSYMAAVRVGQRVALGLERLRARDAATAHELLRRRALEERPSALSHQHMFLHSAFLVRASDVGAFDGAVGELRRRLPHALTRAVGPRPPYAFVELRHQRKEPTWA